MDEQENNQTDSDSDLGQAELERLQHDLDSAREDAQKNLAGWQRAHADLENFRRRKEVESADWVAFGTHSAFSQIIPVLDSLEQALTHAPELPELKDNEKYQNWKNGLQGIVKQLQDSLAGIGIEKIAAIGNKFDPQLHEAVREVPGEEDGIVAEQYQTGYTLNGKTIRPAQVSITKKE